MLIIRNFKKEDINNGLLDTLKEVWSLDEISEEILNEWINNNNHMVVAEYDGKIIGTATLHLQKKLIRNGAIAGLIEEVAVMETHRGQNIGSMMIQKLVELAKNFGCYKIILSCFPERINFYERNGFFVESSLMRMNLI